MTPMTLLLPEDLKLKAEERADAEGISLGEFVKISIETSLATPGPQAEDPLLADDVVFYGPTPADLAARHDDYLYGEDQ